MVPKRSASPTSPSRPTKRSSSPETLSNTPTSDALASTDDSYLEQEINFTYHVFRSSHLFDYKRPRDRTSIPKGVFATRHEAVTEVKVSVERFCMRYERARNAFNKYYLDEDEEAEDYAGEFKQERKEHEDIERLRIEIDMRDGSFVEAWVETRCQEVSVGEVWLVSVHGAVKGTFNSRVGAEKAVLREMKALQEGIMPAPEGMACFIASDAFGIKATKANDTKEVIVKAEKWGLQN